MKKRDYILKRVIIALAMIACTGSFGCNAEAKASWKSAYYNTIIKVQGKIDENSSAVFLYIDGDKYPEMILDNYLYTYKNGKVSKVTFSGIDNQYLDNYVTTDFNDKTKKVKGFRNWENGKQAEILGTAGDSYGVAVKKGIVYLARGVWAKDAKTGDPRSYYMASEYGKFKLTGTKLKRTGYIFSGDNKDYKQSGSDLKSKKAYLKAEKKCAFRWMNGDGNKKYTYEGNEIVNYLR